MRASPMEGQLDEENELKWPPETNLHQLLDLGHIQARESIRAQALEQLHEIPRVGLKEMTQ